MSVVSICTGQGHTFDLFTLIYLEEETGLNFSLVLLSFLHPPKCPKQSHYLVWPLAITHPHKAFEADDSNL